MCESLYNTTFYWVSVVITTFIGDEKWERHSSRCQWRKSCYTSIFKTFAFCHISNNMKLRGVVWITHSRSFKSANIPSTSLTRSLCFGIMGVFDIFGSKHGFDPNKFEKEFSQLTGNINKTKQQLARLTQRKRKLNAKLEAFVSIGYILIFLYCYFSIPNDVRATNRVQQFIKGQSKTYMSLLAIH